MLQDTPPSLLDRGKGTTPGLIALEVEVELALFDLWLAQMLEDPTFLDN